MREIKFRQAIFSKGAFHHWHYWGFLEHIFVGPDTSHGGSDVALENSQQYIGSKDKNRKAICEGDIVTHPLCVKEPHDENESCETFIGCIKFEADRGQYFAINTKRNGRVIVMSEAYKFEVIGNTTENLM